MKKIFSLFGIVALLAAATMQAQPSVTTTSYPGIYLGEMFGTPEVGSFALFVKTNRQATLLGYAADSTAETGFSLSFTVNQDGSWDATANGVRAWGQIDTNGSVAAQAFSTNVLSLTLSGSAESFDGVFRTAEGLYTGTYTGPWPGGPKSGKIQALVSAEGHISYFALTNSSGGVFDAALEYPDPIQVQPDRTFYSLSENGAGLFGKLNLTTCAISGTFTNWDDTHGTFSLTRTAIDHPDQPPTLTLLPKDKTVALGAKVTLSVAATGAKPLSYQWSANGADIAGATSSSFVIASAPWSADGVYYSVLVSNSAGQTNAGASVFITQRETIHFAESWTDSLVAQSDGSGGSFYDVQSQDVATFSASLVVPELPAMSPSTWSNQNAIVSFGLFYFSNNLANATSLSSTKAVFGLTNLDENFLDIRVGQIILAKTNKDILTITGWLKIDQSTFGDYWTIEAGPYGQAGWDGPITPVLPSSCEITVGSFHTSRDVYFSGLGSAISTPWFPMPLSYVHLAGFADFAPPSITFLAPTPNARVYDPTVSVQARILDNDPLYSLASVQFSLKDGSLHDGIQSSNDLAVWSYPFDLVPGTNTVQAIAEDSDGNRGTNKVSLYYMVTNPVALVINPPAGGKVTGVKDGQSLEINHSYTATATATTLQGFKFSNWAWTTDGSQWSTSTVAKLSFPMLSNLVLAADFADAQPPTLKVTNLVNLQQWGYSSVPIKGWAKDNAQVTKVQYRLENGPWLDAVGTTAWSGTVTGLVAGAANKLSAYAQDSTGLCSATSKVSVVYNQFLPVNGTYNGLFSASNELRSAANRLHESSGFLKLTVSGKGSYSGSFVLAGKTNSLGTGQFDATGHASKNVGTGANLVAVNLGLSLDPGSDTLTGTLSNSAWVAELRADRAVFVTTNKAPYAGKYTLVFPGAADEGDTATPLGVGYGAVTVNSLGQVALTGSLADGTALSQGTGVSKDGWWPLYASLYGGKGSIWGWLQFTNSLPPDLLGGEVSWIKEVQPLTTKFYRLGFTNVLETQGSLYVAPSNSTMRVIGLTNGVISFIGGNVSVSFTNQVALGANNVVSNQGPAKLTLSLGKANGTFTGTVIVPGAKTSTSFKGAVLQDEAVGWGYFLGTNQSGRVQFQAR